MTTPGSFVEHVDSPLGAVLVVTDTTDRVIGVDWLDHENRLRGLLLKRHGPVAVAWEPRRYVSRASIALRAYFEGRTDALESIAVFARGTPFEERVWAALRRIPAGTTTSYGRLAERLGQPRAVRAVARANAMNPVSVVVPCHRVVGTDGGLTGYAGGLDRKRWLLEHEARWTSPVPGAQLAFGSVGRGTQWGW